MSPFDFNPFSSTFDCATDDNLFFSGHHPHTSFHQSSHPTGSSGLRLKRETQDAYIYVADIPGIKSGCLDMTLKHGDRNNGPMLILHVHHHDEKGFRNDAPGTRPHRLGLRSNVDTERITSNISNGVLTITAPKLSSYQDPPSHSCNIQMTNLAVRA